MCSTDWAKITERVQVDRVSQSRMAVRCLVTCLCEFSSPTGDPVFGPHGGERAGLQPPRPGRPFFMGMAGADPRCCRSPERRPVEVYSCLHCGGAGAISLRGR